MNNKLLTAMLTVVFSINATLAEPFLPCNRSRCKNPELEGKNLRFQDNTINYVINKNVKFKNQIQSKLKDLDDKIDSINLNFVGYVDEIPEGFEGIHFVRHYLFRSNVFGVARFTKISANDPDLPYAPLKLCTASLAQRFKKKVRHRLIGSKKKKDKQVRELYLNMVVHEALHCVGLGHEIDPDVVSIMQAALIRDNTKLSQRDIDLVNLLYNDKI